MDAESIRLLRQIHITLRCILGVAAGILGAIFGGLIR
jgi:hypothetical protein